MAYARVSVLFPLLLLTAGVFVSSVTSAPAASDSFGFNSGVPGGSGGLGNFDSMSQQQYRPFGSDRSCAQLMNDTLSQSDSQVIPERILITADTMGNTFSSGSFIGGSNQQLDTWASQACGQFTNIVGYMKSACQYSSSGSTFNNQQEMVAQRKVAALMSIRDYLCNNNQVALKEMAINNGAQCARRTDQGDFGCSDIQMGTSSSTFVSMLPSSLTSQQRRTLKYGTAIILNMQYYNQEECKYLTDLTNCIQDKYNRGSDFCGSRAASHYGRIFDLTLQGVGCSAGGFSTFNSFGGSNSGFNNNNNFNNFNNNNNNNGFNNRYPNNNNGFDSRYPNNNNNNNNGFGNSGNNWNNQNSGWPNSGNNWNSGSSWNSGSNSNWPQNSGSNSNWPNSNSGSSWPNSHGSSSSSFSSSSWDGFGSGNNPPPYSYRRPNSGSGLQSTMAIIFTLALTACLAL